MDKLNDVLKRLETSEIETSELEKISELIKVRFLRKLTALITR
jgi:hypothetical protein